MTNNPKPPDAARLLHDLQHSVEFRHRRIEVKGLAPQLALLRTWQSERLKKTYADFLTDPRFHSACLFFLSDIYSATDFSQRDHDVERVHAVLSKVVPAPMLSLLTDVIWLNTLTNELDAHLLQVLVDDLQMKSEITPELYADAYRLCDNYAERVDQIDLISSIIPQVANGAHIPMVGLALRVLYGPAHAAGWDDLYSFLKRGFQAFSRLRDVKIFVGTVRRRERRILDQIYASSPDPFTV